MSTNLSEKRRNKMLETLSNLRTTLQDNPETCNMLMEIENELNKKKYGLIWEEHEEFVDEELKSKIPVFVENKDLEICKNLEKEQYNFLLEGDNLHSLYLLKKTHKNKIGLIYIDPPYNTENNEFIYDDKRVGLTDLYRHSKWISFMANRLKIARELLAKDGAIFISIDKNEFAQLKLLCDDIFGEENFIGTLIWRKKYGGGQTDEFFVTEHEYVFGYRKSSEYKWLDVEIPQSDKKYRYVDEKGKFAITKLEKWGSSAHREDRPTMYFSITNPDGDEIYPIAPDGEPGRWRVGKAKLQEIIDNNLIYWKKNEEQNRWIPYEKEYYLESSTKIIKERSILYNLAETGDATKNLTEIFGRKDVFQNPKPVELIKFLIMHSNAEYILDFFAGSGTTGQAVMESNAEDSKNRKFILCTNNENNICKNVTYKRLKTIITGYKDDGLKYSEGLSENLKYYETDYISRFNKSNENYYIVNELAAYIKELVQLEQGIDITNPKVHIIFDEETADTVLFDEGLIKKCEIIYIDRNVMLTNEQQDIIYKNKISICEIPEYYFENEIMEVEGW